MQPLTNLWQKHFSATLVLVLYALAWTAACVYVYTSRVTYGGENGSGASYSVPAVPLAMGLLGTACYWLGLCLLAVFVKARRRFFVAQLVLAVALAVGLSAVFWLARGR
jgi:spore maturation protein SpmB